MLSRLNELDLCGLFKKLNSSLGQVFIQSKKVRTSPTCLGVRAFQSCQGVWHYSWVFRVFLLLFWFVFLDIHVVLHILSCKFCASRLLLLVCCKKVENFIVHTFRYIFFTIIYRLLFCKFYGCYCCYHYLQSHYCNSHYCSYH